MTGAAPRVVIADDDEAVRGAMALLLKLAGFEVEAHEDAASAVAACERERPDCVVLDVRMPGWDEASPLARLVSLPVVLITGDPGAPLSLRALEAGAFALLEKPIAEEVLLDTVRRAIAST